MSNVNELSHDELMQAYSENAALLRWITVAQKLVPMPEQPARNAVAALYSAQGEMFQALFLPPSPEPVEESEVRP